MSTRYLCSFLSRLVAGAIGLSALWFSTAQADSALWLNSGPAGGTVSDLTIAPSAPDTVYALSARSVWRSQNGGASWQRRSYLGRLNAYSLTVNPNDADDVYFIGNDNAYRSTDGGASWAALDAKLGCDPVFNPAQDALTIHGCDQNGGVVTSRDGGQSWANTSAGIPVTESEFGQFLPSILDLASAPAAPQTLYALSVRYDEDNDYQEVISLYKSTDGAQRWELVNDDIGGVRLGFDPLFIAPADPNVLFLVGGTVLKSRDGGVSWQTAARGLPPIGPDENPFGRRRFSVGSADGRTLYLSTPAGVYRSGNGGERWELLEASPQLSVQDGYLEVSMPLTATPAAPGIVYAAADTVLRSSDGGTTWQARDAGFNATSITKLVSSPAAPATLYALTAFNDTPNSIFKSVDGGRFWQPLDLGIENLFFIDDIDVSPLDADRLYVAFSDFDPITESITSQVLSSDDGGAQWTAIDPRINDIVGFDSSVPGSIYAVSDEFTLFRSNDGANWSSVGAGLEDALDYLLIDPSAPTTLYAVYRGFAFALGSRPGSLFKSTDGGLSWTANPINTIIGNHQLADVVMDPRQPAVLYAAVRGLGTIYQSVDGGASWQATTGNLGQQWIHRLAIDPTLPGRLYAIVKDFDAAVDRLYRSDNAGTSWQLIDAASTQPILQDLIIDPAGNGVVLASYGSGTYRVMPDYPPVWADSERLGQGITLLALGERLWGAWYHYDNVNRPTWLLLEGSVNNGLFDAPLFRFSGPAAGGDWNPGEVTSAVAGSVRIDLSNPLAPRFSYRVDGADGELLLAPFKSPRRGGFNGQWWSPQQSGQGVVLLDDGQTLWGVWTTYDANGAPTWTVFDGAIGDDAIVVTDLFLFNGPDVRQRWDSTQVSGNPVGSVTLTLLAQDAIAFDAIKNGERSAIDLVPFRQR